MAKLLVKFGSDVNWRDIMGRSPLYYAVQMENVQLVIMLIANFSSCFALDNHSDPLVPENAKPRELDGDQIKNAIE